MPFRYFCTLWCNRLFCPLLGFYRNKDPTGGSPRLFDSASSSLPAQGLYSHHNCVFLVHILSLPFLQEGEKSVYDEISLGQQTSAKQSAPATTPTLTWQISGSSSITRPSKKTSSHQPSIPRGKHPGPQKSLSKEWRTLSSEVSFGKEEEIWGEEWLVL